MAEILGINELAVHFDTATRLAGRRISEVVRSTAFQVTAAAQALAPVDTGATRASIHASAPGGRPFRPDTLEAEIGPTTRYAVFLEYGTSRMAPHAFMGPALDRCTPAFVQAVTDAAHKLLK